MYASAAFLLDEISDGRVLRTVAWSQAGRYGRLRNLGGLARWRKGPVVRVMDVLSVCAYVCMRVSECDDRSLDMAALMSCVVVAEMVQEVRWREREARGSIALGALSIIRRFHRQASFSLRR